MKKNIITSFTIVTSLLLFTASYAKESVTADPRHVEIFNTWNFCIYCNLNDALLSPETLYSDAHRNANISASYVYRTVMDRLDLTFAFMYSIQGENFTIKNSIVNMINMTYSDLPYLTFINNEGELVNFTGSGLDYGNFRYAHLTYPIFTGTSLVETDFTGAYFTNARFNNTRVYYTNFTDAYLVGADFTNARISYANFTRANLLHAKITEDQLQNSIVCEAILPDGSLGSCATN